MSWRLIGQIFELFGVFIVMPLVVFLDVLPFRGFILLFAVAFLYFLVLLFDTSFPTNSLRHRTFYGWKLVCIRFGIFIAVSTVALWIFQPDYLFIWIRQGNWRLLVSLAIFYPLFSVTSQTLIYRVYFFHRFGDFLKNKWVLLTLNALLFSFVHIVFRNWVALVFTFIGGFVFSWTYRHSDSLWVSVLEHTAYGLWLFIVGFGPFFLLPYWF